MAEAKKDDKKKDDKKEVPAGPHKSVNAVVVELVILFFIMYFVGRFLGFFGGSGLSGSASGGLSYSQIFSNFLDRYGLTNLFYSMLSTYIFFATLLSILFIIGIIYCLIRLHALEKIWKAKINPVPESDSVEAPKNDRWERVVTHISSDNTSDWRLAILESDIILDELLDKEGYIGNTIGDKLKTAVPGDFKTLNNAWEAHKIRNAIAHEGQDFTLTQREARRIVGLYESVFREFDFI